MELKIFKYNNPIKWLILLVTGAGIYYCIQSCAWQSEAPGRRIHETARMRQIGIANSAYLIDHDDRFPPCSSWENRVRSYLDVKVLFESKFPSATTKPLRTAMNQAIGGFESSKIENPKKTVAYFLTNQTSTSAFGTESDNAFGEYNTRFIVSSSGDAFTQRSTTHIYKWAVP